MTTGAQTKNLSRTRGLSDCESCLRTTQLSAELFPIRESFELLVVRQQARYRAKFGLDGAWANDASVCIKVFTKTNSRVSFTADSELYGGGLLISH
jgi:hypothetical protein